MNNLPQKGPPSRPVAAPLKIWRPKPTAVKVAIIATIGLTAGIVFRTPTNDTVLIFTESPAAYTAPASMEQNVQNEENVIRIMEMPMETEPERILLGWTIPLDTATQADIWDMCHQDRNLFCTVMAIAKVESKFDVCATGDSGRSIGLMQINTYWQRDRIEALGVTDLTDYRQNMSVALDYIAWIAEQICPEAPENVYGTHALFMAYNQGYLGATLCWEKGICNTDYSVECCDYFHMYTELLGVEP